MKQTKTKLTHHIPPSLIAGYRGAPQATIAGQIAGLASFLGHRDLFATLGSDEAVVAAERAWWIDAVILAALPASSATEARCKLEALKPAIDGRAWLSAGDSHRGLLAMITTAVEAERCQWSLHAPTLH